MREQKLQQNVLQQTVKNTAHVIKNYSKTFYSKL